jgi:hypothetical protein
MPRILALFALLCILAVPATLPAQVPSAVPTPEQLERMMTAARMMMNPAAQLLVHRAEVGLSASQVAAIQPISDRMEQVVDRVIRWQREMPQRSVAQRMLSDPAMPLDEAAVRAEAHENAEIQADLMIATIRTTREVIEHLTPVQWQAWIAVHARENLQYMQRMVPQP